MAKPPLPLPPLPRSTGASSIPQHPPPANQPPEGSSCRPARGIERPRVHFFLANFGRCAQFRVRFKSRRTPPATANDAADGSSEGTIADAVDALTAAVDAAIAAMSTMTAPHHHCLPICSKGFCDSRWSGVKSLIAGEGGSIPGHQEEHPLICRFLPKSPQLPGMDPREGTVKGDEAPLGPSIWTEAKPKLPDEVDRERILRE